MTGEGWSEIMHNYGKTSTFFGEFMKDPCVASFDVSNEEVETLLKERCLIEFPKECGAPLMSSVFFISFTMVRSICNVGRH
jgi:hypothetical protein